MKFERLRLCGFKSFVEPAEFIIEPGLTGVIGPNGCGKSNLLEAMRWVMGASSAKALRGAGMDDVIFAGAGKRPSRNWAEVTLVLNNSERTAPAQFNDTDVLEVTRRIDRDSGSTYRLNGREVRARDIQLLFADASTGANSPALVRQGQISELINAKPENRRRLLEEAAGITGLHSRRREAELRLKAAEGNLTRLDDVVGQLESQQAALKRQARQAVRYRSLSSDIRKTEALAAYLRWSDAQSDLEASERALSEADQSVADAARESATAAKHQAEAAGAAPPLRDREVEAAAALHRLVVARDAIDKEEERARKEAERLAAQLGELSQDVERESNLLQDAEKALSSLSDEEKRLAANSAGDGAAVEEAAKVLSEKNETLDRAEGELDRLNTEAANLEAKRRSVLSARADVGKRLERLRRQAEDDRAELGDIAEKRTGQTEADEALRTQEAAAASLAAAEQAVFDLEARRGEVEASAQTRRAAAADADAALAELRAEVSALEKVLKAGGETASAPLLDALQVRPGFETALAAALGSDLSAPTDPAAAAHWRQATPTCAEGARVLPDGVQSLAEMVDGPAFLQARLARIGVVDAPPTAEMLGALAPGVRLVSRNGDLWRWDGFVASARAKTPQAVRLEHQARLRELAAPLAQAEETASAAQTASKAAGEALSQLRGADGAARSEVRARREAANAAQKAAERLAAQSREIAGKIAALEEAGRRLETEIHEAEAEDRSAQTVLEGLPDGEALRTQLAAAREAVSQYRGEVAEARSRHATTAREADARRTRLKEIELERQVWRDRAETANKRLEALDIRRAETDNALKAARTSPERLETERASLVDQIDAAERRRAGAADDLAAAETRLADADQTL
ncbi:MAG: AAA family ATPase, partial [Pseudomonadota bacterium]